MKTACSYIHEVEACGKIEVHVFTTLKGSMKLKIFTWKADPKEFTTNKSIEPPCHQCKKFLIGIIEFLNKQNQKSDSCLLVV